MTTPEVQITFWVTLNDEADDVQLRISVAEAEQIRDQLDALLSNAVQAAK